LCNNSWVKMVCNIVKLVVRCVMVRAWCILKKCDNKVFSFSKDVCNHQEHWKWWTQFIWISFRSQIFTFWKLDFVLNIVYILYTKFQQEILLYKEKTISNCILKCEIRGWGMLVHFIHYAIHPRRDGRTPNTPPKGKLNISLHKEPK